jgi:hypothetical protein
MTNHQESRLNMYLTLREFQLSYSAITATLPNYSVNSATFVDTILQIQRIAEQQKLNKKGVTESKNLLKEKLIVMTADYSRKLSAYARLTNNTLLAQEVKLNESKLRQVADTAVKNYAQIVFDCAQASLTELKPYEIGDESQASLMETINSYNDSIGKPGVIRTEGSQNTRQLDALFKVADRALANMDAVIEIIRLTQPDFYASYKNARKVIERGVGSFAVKGFITAAANGEPIKGATLSFELDRNGDTNGLSKAKHSKIIKRSAQKGGYIIKSLPAGIYNVTIKKIGYAEQTVKIAVADGDRTELNINLSKN